MLLEEVEDRARHVRLAVAAGAGHERVLALDDDAVAGAALVGVERRRLTLSSRALSHCGKALRGGGGSAGSSSSEPSSESGDGAGGAFFFFFFSVNMGWSPSSSSSTFGFCSTLGLTSFFGSGLTGTAGRAAPASAPGAAAGTGRLRDGERSRRLRLDDARRSEAALAVVVGIVITI